ncbi:MAG: DUF2470 domain-containing protein [Nostocales cyanobacterium]|nr:MAG: DUF2470 domain-containing protein [Nostocales cyanobacterium]TAF06316.1 MAG: DUF2470 domain-containing protein [Nostocales cyanobacterium]
MSDQFSPEISSRICKHMNEDHADAVIIYAQAFSDFKDATAAEMLSIDAEGMNLSVKSNEKTFPVRIQFDHTLADAEDAHQTLIAMVKQGRQKM